ncbi:MAG: sensor histidine kinase [Lachnospiraceae bacterium]|nr:sensor histidine kinase [Lachnospiraceae bacterium]
MVNKFVDKGLVILLCVFCAFLRPVQAWTIAGMLVAISVSALSSYFEDKISMWICLAYAAACVFSSDLFMFLPLIVYDCFKSKNSIVRYSFAAPVLLSLLSREPQQIISVALLSMLAMWLSSRSGIYDEIENRYYTLEDETKENAMALERKNRELMEKQDYEVRLATLGERNRIAREIHDNVGHLLTRALLQVGALQIMCRDNEETGEYLSAVKDTLSDAMDNIRSSVHDLHDESVDLRISVCMLIDEFTFCPVKLNYDMDNPPKDIKYSFISIIKEALSNIAKHSNATQARISLLEHPAFYQLIVEDNGTRRVGADKEDKRRIRAEKEDARRAGTDEEDKRRAGADKGYSSGKRIGTDKEDNKSKRIGADNSSAGGFYPKESRGGKSDGIGLQNMKDRVDAFNGTFRVDRNKGFRIFISIPKEKGNESSNN